MKVTRRTESSDANCRQRRLRFERCEPRLLLSREPAVVSLDSSVFADSFLGSANAAPHFFYSTVEGRIVQQREDSPLSPNVAGVTARDFVHFHHSSDVLTSEVYDLDGFSAQWTRASGILFTDSSFFEGLNLTALQGGAEKIARISPVADPTREAVRNEAADPAIESATEPTAKTVADPERPQFLDLAGIWESMSERDIDETFANGRNDASASRGRAASFRTVASPHDELTRVGAADALGRASYFELAGATESTTPQVKLANRSIARQFDGPTKISTTDFLEVAPALPKNPAKQIDVNGAQPIDEGRDESWPIEPAETVHVDAESSSDNVERPNDASASPVREPLSRTEPLGNLRRGPWLVGGLVALFGVDRYLRRASALAKSPPAA